MSEINCKIADIERRLKALESRGERVPIVVDDLSTLLRSEAVHSSQVSLVAFWRNLASGIVHAQWVILDSKEPVRALTKCGWECIESISGVRVSAIPEFHKHLCEKCFPEYRGARKRRLRSQAAELDAQVGEDGVAVSASLS